MSGFVRSRALAGVGVVLAWNAAANLCGRTFGPGLRATVLGIFTATALLTTVSVTGSFAAPIVAGWLIERSGSFLPAFGYAVATAIVGVSLAWFAPEPKPGADSD